MDRKEWELTDLEVFDNWRPDAPLKSSARSIATTAAHKALEWAAKEFETRALERTHSHCAYDPETNAYECSEVIEAVNEEDDNCAELLRKELTDG